MPMYNLIEYSQKNQEVYGNTIRDEPALVDGCAVANFPGNSASFKFKQK